MNCRHCSAALELTLIDLGSAPPSNAYLTSESLYAPEKTFPLIVMVCDRCWLVQTRDFADAGELFSNDYAYFSSFSSSWLEHAERYVAKMTEGLGLGAGHHVVEVASNDGYLLQYVARRGITCTGIEPTSSTAAAARARGIDTIESFFGAELGLKLAKEGRQADLTAANNVLAHVPDINDFLTGFVHLLKADGVATFEFPHLCRMIAENQFDTIYHEHFSYLSLTAVDKVFAANGLTVFDVEELRTHGGSLRVYAQRTSTGKREIAPAVRAMLEYEAAEGTRRRDYYSGFQQRAEKVKDDFLTFLLDAKRAGKKVAGYGAAAKGNTLMNFAGCRRDLIAFVVDRNPAKQGRFMPGSRIPILEEQALRDARPDYVVILPWNLRPEVSKQLDYIRDWGGLFVTAVPELEIS